MELVKVTYLGTTDDLQTYSELDKSLISSNFINTEFGQPDDYIELFVYDLNNEIIFRNYTNVDYKIGENVNPVSGLTSQVTLDPEKDIKNAGIDRGSVVVQYNFFRRLLASQAGRRFWIKEISPSRTEIKVARQDISNDELSSAFDAFSATLAAENYYPDFYLNFGDNAEVLGVNAIYTEEEDVAYIIFKLYEPLPTEFDLKSQFWVVQKVAEPARFQVDIEVEAETTTEQFKLRGPNYDIDLAQAVGQTTPYYNYNNLFTTPITSSLQQLKSYLEDQAVGINVDYSDFGNFIHFSSATERIHNFVYKLRLIELYQSSSAALATVAPGAITTQIVNNSTNTLQQNIDNIINKFDPYEYYLYFSSASTAWPKSNDVEPYTLYSVTSSQALAWLGSADTVPTAGNLSILYSASLYDNANSDGLRYTAPTYIREDDTNEPYLVFLDMIGQHFDNIWLYYKDVSNKYSADNNPNVGISLDIVSEALKGFGVQLYTNTNLSDNIYYSLLGVGNEGSTLPLTSSLYAQIELASSSLYPNPLSASLLLTETPEFIITENPSFISLDGVMGAWLSSSIYLPPFGNEKYNKYVTPFKVAASGITSSFDQLSPATVEQEIYKRIYHNLPYLLKTKGTERGVRALIACYGIPDSILTVNEYGGHERSTAFDIQGIQDNKVYTGSVIELADKLLSPFVSIQEYDNSFTKNSPDVEIAFSPADSINADITSSLPNLSVQQLIGSPALQYSSSYDPLVETANAYFKANYTKGYNVWDFIRVIKFYNNSLFKMLKDFVPARASLTTGIVIKSHMLERNKYARHEPVMTTSSFADDITMISISASDADQIKYSTAYTSSVQTVSGSVTINNIYSAEKYTGEFGGSGIVITDGEALSQLDYSISATSGSIVGEINYGALFQNVTSSVKSTTFFDLDYSTNAVIPVNYGIVTKSLNSGPAALSDPYAPFAQLQDYNYLLRRSILPRYLGSKSTSKFYNVYTVGDSSYGLSAAIDRNSYKLGWVKNIPSKTLNFPDKTQIFLKYLVDADSKVIDLSLNNTNVFEVQNTFKSGDRVKVSISDVTKPSNQKTLDGLKKIYRGGFSFDPIFYKEGTIVHNFRWTEPVFLRTELAGVKGHSLNWSSGTYGKDRTKPTIIGLAIVNSVSLNDNARNNPASTPATNEAEVGFTWTKNYSKTLEDSPMAIGLPNISQYNFAQQFPDLHRYDWTCFEVAVDKTTANRTPIDDPTSQTTSANYTHIVTYPSNQDISARFGTANFPNGVRPFFIPSNKYRGVNYAGTGKRFQDGKDANRRSNWKFNIAVDDTEYTVEEATPYGGNRTEKIFEDRILIDTGNNAIKFQFSPYGRPAYVFEDVFNFNIFSSSIYDFQPPNQGPGFYRELSDITNGGSYMYVAPRKSTYTIEGSFPVHFEFSYDAFVHNYVQDYFYNTLLGTNDNFKYDWNIPAESLPQDKGDPGWYEGFMQIDFWWSDSGFPKEQKPGVTNESDRSTRRVVQWLLNSFASKPGSNAIPPLNVVNAAVKIANRGLESVGITYKGTTKQTVTYKGQNYTVDCVTIPLMEWDPTKPYTLRQSGFTNKSTAGVIDGSWSTAIMELCMHPYMVSQGIGFVGADFFDKPNIHNRLRYPGFSFRLYGVIEKCSNINDTNQKWDYVCSTKIIDHSFYGNNLNQCDRENNFINIGSPYGEGFVYDLKNELDKSSGRNPLRASFTCAFADDDPINGVRGTKVNVPLQAGDVLRFRFFLLDFDSFTNNYGKAFTIEIGNPDITGQNKKLGYPQFSTLQPKSLIGLVAGNLQNFPTPNLSIVDTVQQFDVYEYVNTITGSTVYSVEGNSIILNDAYSKVAIKSSTFEPQAPASDNYSPVIDEFTVKQGDLVRFGAFNENVIKYYTVAKAGIEKGTILTTRVAYKPINTAKKQSILSIQLFPDNTKATALLDPDQTKVAKFFSLLSQYKNDVGFKITYTSKQVAGLTNTIMNQTIPIIAQVDNITDYLIQPNSIPFFPQGLFFPPVSVESHTNPNYKHVRWLKVYVVGLMPNTAGTYIAAGYDYNIVKNNVNPVPANLINTTFEVVPLPFAGANGQSIIDQYFTDFYKITFDTDMLDATDLTINGQQLAILRPKPDETSVILDFKKKQPGEVAQTVLIPQDANQELQDSVGTIYENLNTSLMNQQL